MIHKPTGPTLALYNFLIQKAKAKSISNYTEAGALVGLEAHDPTFWNMLAEVSEYSHQEYGVLLSVLVVNFKSGFPGGSFFDLANSLKGVKIRDKLRFFCEEYTRCHKTDWGKDEKNSN